MTLIVCLDVGEVGQRKGKITHPYLDDFNEREGVVKRAKCSHSFPSCVWLRGG